MTLISICTFCQVSVGAWVDSRKSDSNSIFSGDWSPESVMRSSTRYVTNVLTSVAKMLNCVFLGRHDFHPCRMQYAAAGIGMVVVACACFFRCCGRARRHKGRDKNKKDSAVSSSSKERSAPKLQSHSAKAQRGRRSETKKTSSKFAPPPSPSLYDEDQRHLLSASPSPSPRRKSRSPSPRRNLSTSRREQQLRDLYDLPSVGVDDNDIFMFPLMDDNHMRQHAGRRPPRRKDLHTINFL